MRFQTEDCCKCKPTFETLHGIDSFCQTDFVQKLNDVECQTDIESVIFYNEIQNDIYEDVRTENKGNICDCCNLSDVTKQLKIAINIDHTHIDLNQFSSNSNISTLSLSLHNDAQDLNDDQHFEEKPSESNIILVGKPLLTSSPFKYSFVSGSIIDTNFDCIQHSDDYKNDPTYIPLNCDDDSIHVETSLIVKDDDDTASVVQENKYIVFHKCIMSLINMIACSM